MAKFRPTARTKPYGYQQRRVFSGSHNAGHRVTMYTLNHARTMLAALTALSSTFPSPPVSLPDMDTAISALSDAAKANGGKGRRGSKLENIAMLEARLQLKNIISAQTAYVQAVARTFSPNNNYWNQLGTMIAGSGLAKKTGRLNLPQIFGLGTGSNLFISAKTNRQPIAPANLRVIHKSGGPTGRSFLRWGKLKTGVAYNVYSCDTTTGAPVGITHTVTAAAFTANGVSGEKQCIRVQAIGPNGTKSPLSQPLFYTII